MTTIRLGLIRHAETLWNREKRIQGQCETDLSPTGRDQALAWGHTLAGRGYTLILASDLGRAMQTAQLVNQSLGLPLMTDQRLREQDWGHWVGRTLPDLLTNSGGEFRRQEKAAWEFRPPGGENRKEVLARAKAALNDTILKHPEDTILVVTHLGVVKCLIYDLLELGFEPDTPDPVAKRTLHELTYSNGRFNILHLNMEL
ncbi:histidine phosphatase family protein [Desulfovibrio ferrophilus]|uniref:Phosphoglycerate mutase n=1 Tax=Desulfovibrio ferrophilus TaxID=241368 RepID=A0A2Z6AY37_9BACT|nr:histidine phosphatase family protein [Desulfovibrio ferrophilus]BBD08182.1 phosphoglycerate mutase [Desulfovibrio ferrophilus]